MGKAITPIGIDEQYSITSEMKTTSTIISLTDVVARQDSGLEEFEESRFLIKVLIELCFISITAKLSTDDIKELFRETLTHTDIDIVIARQAKHAVSESFIKAIFSRITSKIRLLNNYKYSNYGGFSKGSETDDIRCTSYEIDVLVFN